MPQFKYAYEVVLGDILETEKGRISVSSFFTSKSEITFYDIQGTKIVFKRGDSVPVYLAPIEQ